MDGAERVDAGAAVTTPLRRTAERRNQMSRRLRAALVLLVLVAAAGASAPSAADTAAAPQPGETAVSATAATAAAATSTTQHAGTAAATQTAGSDIRLETSLSLTPERPGEITVRLRFAPPDRVTSLTTTIDAAATVVSSQGFDRVGGARYEWDGRTATPTLTYRLPANRTSASGRFDAAATPGRTATPGQAAPSAAAATQQYLLADAGPWAIVSIPWPAAQWRYTGATVGLERRTVVDGAGVVGTRLAFLGEHRVVERTASGQTFRLVVPAAADLREQPDDVLASLASASAALRVGDRDPVVTMIAAPTSVDWAVRGLQVGEADAWVRADERLSTADNPWLHEYVHTRQSFATTNRTKWVVEGSADYYAALLTLRQDRIDFERFAANLERGSRQPYSGVVLADPETWVSGAQYLKGGLVVGVLDRRIRLASDRSHSFGSVFSALNGRDDAVTQSAFLAAVAAAGNDSVAAAADRFTTTTAAPEMWTQAEHEAAFGALPARVGYTLPEVGRVSGVARNETVRPPFLLAAGETLRLPVEVVNDGGAAGEYRVALAVDNRTVDVTDGEIQPETATTVTLSHRFDEPGQYRVELRGRSYVVRVREPATPTVASVTANRSTVRPGGAVAVTATVANDAPVPAVGHLPVTVDGDRLRTESVAVAPNGSVTLRVVVAFDEPGTHRVAVGNRSTTVTVQEPTAATSTRTPGFGAVAGALALLLCGLVGAANAKRREK